MHYQHNAAANAIIRALQSTKAEPGLVDQLTKILLVFGTENLNKQRIFTPVLMTAIEIAQAEVWNTLSPASDCAQKWVLPFRVLTSATLTMWRSCES